MNSILIKEKVKKEFEMSILELGIQRDSELSIDKFVKIMTKMRYISNNYLPKEREILMYIWN